MGVVVKMTQKLKLVVPKKNYNSKIKAIIFDVNGVLLKGQGKSVHEFIARKLKVSLEEWFDSIDQYWNEMVKDESTTNHAMHKLSIHYRVPKHKLEKIIKTGFKKHFRKNRPMFKLLKKLRKNYKIAILSDQLLLSYSTLKKYKFDKRADIIIWSHKQGIRKPNPDIYKLVCQRLKLPANQCLFIDDRDWNLIPAKNLGMSYILFHNYKQLFEQLKHLEIIK